MFGAAFALRDPGSSPGQAQSFAAPQDEGLGMHKTFDFD
jgi:hypothetical protein